MKQKKLSTVILSFAVFAIFSSCQKQPEADFTLNKTEAFTGDTIFFTNTTINGDHYKWDFGDGANSTDESPSHIYTKAGEYNIVLTAYSEKDKKTSTREQSIKTEKANEIEYNGNKYPVSKVYVDIWGDHNGTYDYYHFSVSLVSEGITFTENDVLGIGNVMMGSLWSPSPTSIVPGIYTFADNYAAMSYNFGLIGLNYDLANDIGTSFECTGGSINVAQEDTEYIFDFNYTLATGKIVKAHFKGTLLLYDHTDKQFMNTNKFRILLKK